MRKFLAVAALVLGIFIGQAEASDVYVGEWEGGWKAYLMTETQRGTYSDSKITCTIKTVSPKGTVKYIDYSTSSRPSEVYVGMNDYGDAEIYILPDTIRDITFQGYSGFSVQIKSSDGNSPRVPWNFVRKDGAWCYLLSLEDWAYPVPAKGIVLKVAETASKYR